MVAERHLVFDLVDVARDLLEIDLVALADHVEGVADFRRALDDKNIDVLVVAAPNHWHAPATILGCSAGKHVYCEKPACHNPREGELAVAAARKNNRVVQLGTQRRSFPTIIEAINKIHDGEIGPVHYSRVWYNNNRPSIGHGKPVADGSAIAFARRFYAEITRGQSIKQAYFASRNALAEQGLSGASEIDLTGDGDLRLDEGFGSDGHSNRTRGSSIEWTTSVIR